MAKKLSAFEKKFAEERKKQGAGGTFKFKVGGKMKTFTTDYEDEPKKKSVSVKDPLRKPKDVIDNMARGKYKIAIVEVSDLPSPQKVVKDFYGENPELRDLVKKDLVKRVTEVLDLYKKEAMKPKKKMKTLGEFLFDKLPKAKKKSEMNIGGLTQSPMMNGLSRKINPTTGLTMNKGGMIDYRKKGMFYGGGMARRGR